MDRKLTSKERCFLAELSALLDDYDCLMSVEGNAVCFEVEDVTKYSIPVKITGLNAHYDIDAFVIDNI